MAFSLERRAAALAVRTRTLVNRMVSAARRAWRVLLGWYLRAESAVAESAATFIQTLWHLKMLLALVAGPAFLATLVGYYRGQRFWYYVAAAWIFIALLGLLVTQEDQSAADEEQAKEEWFKSKVVSLFRGILRIFSIAVALLITLFSFLDLAATKLSLQRIFYDSVTLQNSCSAPARMAVFYQDPLLGWRASGWWELSSGEKLLLPLASHGPLLGVYVDYGKKLVPDLDTTGLALGSGQAYRPVEMRVIRVPDQPRFSVDVSKSGDKSDATGGLPFQLYRTGTARVALTFTGSCMEKPALPQAPVAARKSAEKQVGRNDNKRQPNR